MSTCSRRSCTKTLRSNNTKGVCGSACESPDAPPAHRAKRVTQAAQPSSGGALDRFRAVHLAMGIDPEPVLEEFCNEWLNGVRAALEG